MIRFALALGLVSLAGCQKLECAEGTFADGDTCVGYDPSDATPPVTTVTPPGGRTRAPVPEIVTLTTDEPARIFHTIDGRDPSADDPGEQSPVTIVGIAPGTTLKYFAIDRAGNREAMVSLTFDHDATPPRPISGLTLELTGADATLRWTNPADADYAGTVIARVADAIDANPEPGKLYTAPAALSPTIQIVAAGRMTELVDPGRPPGPVRYVAWTFDDLGNYSRPVSVGGAVPLGALAARFTYDTTNNTLTPTLSPDHLDLTTTTAALAGTTLTLSLGVKNDTAHYFQNLKAEVTAVANASFTGSDGTADGFPFRALGPQLLAPGATVTRDLVFGGVVAGSIVSIDLTLAHHASLLGTAGQTLQRHNVVDLGSGVPQPIITALSRGPNDRATGRVRPGRFVGGRYLDIATTHGTIERWDLVTRTLARSVRLGDDIQRMNIQGLYTAGDTTFAVVKYGGNNRTGPAELVRIDEALQITGRLDLQREDGNGFGRAAFSADHSLFAVPLIGGVALVDVETMTLVDATPNTPEVVDPIVPGFTGPIRAVQFFDNTAGLVVLARRESRAAIVRRTADDYTVTLHQEAGTTTRGYGLAAAADGKIWMAFATGIRAFDPTTGNVSTIAYATASHGLAIVDGAMWILRSDRATLDQVSPAGAVQRTIVLPAANRVFGHWLLTAR